MKQIRLTIPLVTDDNWDVEAFQFGSFAVHLGGRSDEQVWTITHMKTGMNAVNGTCFSKSRAFKIARMLNRVFSDSDMELVVRCAALLRKGGTLTKEDDLKYHVLYSMMWADGSVSRYAR